VTVDEEGMCTARKPVLQTYASCCILLADGDGFDRIACPLLSAQVGDSIAGALHEWGAELIGNRALRARCRNAVDIAFAAARPDGAARRWELGGGDRGA
jgi:hypothetical protein